MPFINNCKFTIMCCMTKSKKEVNFHYPIIYFRTIKANRMRMQYERRWDIQILRWNLWKIVPSGLVLCVIESLLDLMGNAEVSKDPLGLISVPVLQWIEDLFWSNIILHLLNWNFLSICNNVSYGHILNDSDLKLVITP